MKKNIFAITLIIASMLLAGCNLNDLHLTSSMTIAVPNVVGLTKDDAESNLSNAGLASETVLVESDTVPADCVVRTDPDAGQQIEPSKIVKIFVSKGQSSSVTVPDVIGRSLEDATSTLRAQGLTVGDIKYKDSDKAKDTVILSDPLPGVSVSSGSKINLTLSAGSKKERTLVINMDVPDSNDEIEFTVYINGKLTSSYTTSVNPKETKTVSFEFKGSSGKKTVKVKANKQEYKSYRLDFDKGEVSEI